MPDSDTAVEARCHGCGREFYTIDEPQQCPHCGDEDLAVNHGVVVRPA